MGRHIRELPPTALLMTEPKRLTERLIPKAKASSFSANHCVIIALCAIEIDSPAISGTGLGIARPCDQGRRYHDAERGQPPNKLGQKLRQKLRQKLGLSTSYRM